MSLQKYFTKLMLTDEDKKHQLQHTVNGTYSSWIRAHRYYKHFDPRKHSIRYGSKAKPTLPPINIRLLVIMQVLINTSTDNLQHYFLHLQHLHVVLQLMLQY